jgi:hypothetical protein
VTLLYCSAENLTADFSDHKDFLWHLFISAAISTGIILVGSYCTVKQDLQTKPFFHTIYLSTKMDMFLLKCIGDFFFCLNYNQANDPDPKPKALDPDPTKKFKILTDPDLQN